ncbi:Uncharacterized protein HZ326_14969 [Fusarium oxysporum f. sp. albedinis]|nr:Uncharacterized protein HZ326_14969 [Fusarium oxysporum f. sp. albedinis]
MQTMRFLQSPPKSGMQTRATVETLYHGWPELHSLSMDSGKQAVTMEFGRLESWTRSCLISSKQNREPHEWCVIDWVVLHDAVCSDTASFSISQSSPTSHNIRGSYTVRLI